MSLERHSRPAFILRTIGAPQAPLCELTVCAPAPDTDAYQCGELLEHGHAVLLPVSWQLEYSMEEQADPCDKYQGWHREKRGKQGKRGDAGHVE
jgi:hypothetical protein